jgi:excisionase family DNA binding protein
MTELFVLEAVAVDDPMGRIPDDLALAGPERDVLEKALRRTGLAIVAVDAVVASPTSESADNMSHHRQLRASVAAVVNEADGLERDRLEAAVTADPDDGLEERFWGPGPDSVTASQAVFADLSDQFAQRRQLAAASVTRDEAAELLGIAAQSITSKLAAHKLVGIKVGRQWRLPTWQFDPDNPSGVLPDLDILQAVFPGGVVSLSKWMLRQQPEFDGRTPREELALHDSASVIALASGLTAAGW